MTAYLSRLLRLDRLPPHIIDGRAAQTSIEELLALEPLVRAVEAALHDSATVKGLRARLVAEVAVEATVAYLASL